MKCLVRLTVDAQGAERLAPAYEVDQEEFNKLKPGNYYKADIRKARNPAHHNKGMRLIRDVFENQDRYETMEDLLVEFKLRTGWYTEHISMKGKVMYIPKSLDFASMDQTAFDEFYSRAIDVAVQYFNHQGAVEYV